MSGSIFSFQAKTVWWTKNRYKLWKEIIFSTVENQNNFTGFTHVYPFFTTPQPRRANTDYPVFSKITLKDHLVVWRVPRVNFWKRSGSSIVNSNPVQYLPPKIFVCGESWRLLSHDSRNSDLEPKVSNQEVSWLKQKEAGVNKKHVCAAPGLFSTGFDSLSGFFH